MEAKERREAEENFWDARREANIRREEQRWEAMEAAEDHQAQIEVSLPFPIAPPMRGL